jgi:hypothetical protein
MGAMQRTKGAVAEREIVAILREHGWTHADRTSDGRRQHGRGDITSGPAGVHIEIKRHERLNVPAAVRQAHAEADPLDVPIVVHRPSRCEWMATLPLDELLALLALRERS